MAVQELRRRGAGLGSWSAGSRLRRASVLGTCVLIAALAQWLRLSPRARDTLYAEDGRTFLGDWVLHPSVGLFYEPYAGYQHLLPRVISFLISQSAPVDWWANGIAVLASIAVGGISVLTFVLSRDVLQSPAARFGLAVIPILLPIARLEAVANIANLHWYALYLVPWLVLAIPRSRSSGIALSIATFVAVMTEPQAILLAPLVIHLLIRDRENIAARLPVLLGWALGSVVQGVTYLGMTARRPSDLSGGVSALKGYAINAVATEFTTSGPRLGSIVLGHGWWIPFLGLGLLLLMAVGAFALGTVPIRRAVVAVVGVSVSSWAASYFLNDHSLFRYDSMLPARLATMPLVRWATAAAMLLIAVVPLFAGAVAGRWPRLRWARIVPVAMMIAVMAASFDRGDTVRGGPSWNGQLEIARAHCARDGVVEVAVPTSPSDWDVQLPCQLLRN